MSKDTVNNRPKTSYDYLFDYLFRSPDIEPPEIVLKDRRITNLTLATCFLMNPFLCEYFTKFLKSYNVYAVSKKEMLIHLKKLIKKLKISEYDFWSIAQRKDAYDPLAKTLWDHYEIRPSDIPYIRSMFGDNVDKLLKSAHKVKKQDLDIFEKISNQLSKYNEEKQTTNIRPINVSSSLINRLNRYKMHIKQMLDGKQMNASQYLGCYQCRLKSQPYVLPDWIINDPDRDEVDILIVGMNPYKDEIKYGKPFVGQSGKYLRQVLQEMFPQYNIVITNTCMCFIPDNGDPTHQDISCCRDLLIEQIKIVKPKVVVPLGSIAVKNFIQSQKGITKLAGQIFKVKLNKEE